MYIEAPSLLMTGSESWPSLLPQTGIASAGAVQERVPFLGLPLARRPIERLDLLPVFEVHGFRGLSVIVYSRPILTVDGQLPQASELADNGS
jgi:hypothetical protein